MDNNIQELLADFMLKSVQDLPMHGNVSLNQDKALILLTRMKTFTDEERNAVFDLVCNLVAYTIYGMDLFLDPHLFGNIPDVTFRNRKESRDFALGYLQTGGIIKIVDDRIQIVSERELRSFAVFALMNLGFTKWFDKQSVDEGATPRFLRTEEHSTGLKLFEVNQGKEEELHYFQSESAVRSFFDECWKSPGIKISFAQLRKAMPLNPRQKLKPTEYLESIGLQSADRLHRYAFVNPEEGYVFFQRHYASEPLRKSVLNEYRNMD